MAEETPDDRDRFGDDNREPRPKKKSGGIPVVVIVLIVLGVCCVGSVPVAIGLLLPAVQKVREAAARSKDQNNLKQIVLAEHFHADSTGVLSTPQFVHPITRAANPGLSHRVAILPYIEQDSLYKAFDVAQPWDHPRNRSYGDTFIATFYTPVDPQGTTTTRYQGFAGPGAMYDPTLQRPLRMTDVSDGTSNTILMVTSDEQVVWSKPQDLPYNPNLPVSGFGKAFGGGTNILMVDGSVRFLRNTASDTTKHALITRNGGEALGGDW